MSFAKKRFRDRLVTKEQRLKVLHKIWDSCFEDLKRKCKNDSGKKDSVMKQFMIQFELIDPKVKSACLREYLEKCEMKQMIAYYQWRYRYSPVIDESQHCCKRYDREQIKENLEGLQGYIGRSVNLGRCPTLRTQKMAKITYDLE